MSKGYHRERYKDYEVHVRREGRTGGFAGFAIREGHPTLTTARFVGPGAKAAALNRIREIIDGMLPKATLRWGGPEWRGDDPEPPDSEET